MRIYGMILAFALCLFTFEMDLNAEEQENPAELNNQLEKKFFSKTHKLLAEKDLSPQQIKKILEIQSNTLEFLKDQKEEIENLKKNLNITAFEDSDALGTADELAARMHDLQEKTTKYLKNAISELDKI